MNLSVCPQNLKTEALVEVDEKDPDVETDVAVSLSVS